MKTALKTLVHLGLLAVATTTFATDYNHPGDDKLYTQCLREASRLYEGGNEPSPVRGQNKLQAWCTCMWNETPDDFKGSLVRFSETAKGKSINKTCEKHSNWSE